MPSQKSWEPDFAAESAKFRKDSAEKGMCLDTYPGGGGFYVDQRTQHAWAEWIRRVVAEQMENQRLQSAESALDEWVEKTEWEQKTCHWSELGKHRADVLRERIEQLQAGFKNFNRSLCERFGYFHDEIDWQRDQVSLEEHIATQLSHVNAENAALRGQVEALQRGAGQLQEEKETLIEDLAFEKSQVEATLQAHAKLLAATVRAEGARDQLASENEALRKAALDAREFIVHEAEVRGLLDENNEVSFRHPRRQAAIASIDAAMSKGRSVVCGSEQGSPAPEAPSLQRSVCGSEHP